MSSLGQVVELEWASIRPFAAQPRKYFDKAALRDLARSIGAVGQQVPVTVRKLDTPAGAHLYELIDGQRRWTAIGMIGQETIKAWVTGIDNEADQYLSSVVSNFAREGHSPMEVAQAIKRLRQHPKIAAIESRTQQAEAIADVFGRTKEWVYGYESLMRLHPNLQAMLDPHLPDSRRLSFRVAQYVAQLATEEQLAAVAHIFKKRMNRAQGVSFARAQAMAKGTNAVGRPSGERARSGRAEKAIVVLATAVADVFDVSMPEFEAAILRRNASERESLMYRIQNAIDRLTQLKRMMIKKAA